MIKFRNDEDPYSQFFNKRETCGIFNILHYIRKSISGNLDSEDAIITKFQTEYNSNLHIIENYTIEHYREPALSKTHLINFCTQLL